VLIQTSPPNSLHYTLHTTVPIWTDYGMEYSEVNVSFDPAQNNDETALRASREYVLKNNPDVRLCVSVSVFMCVLVMYTKLTDIHSHTLSHTSGRYVRRPPSQGQPWTSEIADEHQHSPILPHIRRQVCICTYGYECIVVYVLYVCTCV
jgi:hypothetical protein